MTWLILIGVLLAAAPIPQFVESRFARPQLRRVAVPVPSRAGRPRG